MWEVVLPMTLHQIYYENYKTCERCGLAVSACAMTHLTVLMWPLQT